MFLFVTDETKLARRQRETCYSGYFRCENGPCIRDELRCNGKVDCPHDTSDELDCPEYAHDSHYHRYYNSYYYRKSSSYSNPKVLSTTTTTTTTFTPYITRYTSKRMGKSHSDFPTLCLTD